MGMKGITVQHVIAAALIMIAVALLFLLGSLNQFEPGERWEVLALATQEVSSSLIGATQAVSLSTADSSVEVIERDTQCLRVDIDINGIHYPEYEVGYLISGDLVKRTGRTYLNYYEVTVDSSSRISRYTGNCWLRN